MMKKRKMVIKQVVAPRMIVKKSSNLLEESTSYSKKPQIQGCPYYSLRIKIDGTVDFWLQIWPLILFKKIMQKHKNMNHD